MKRFLLIALALVVLTGCTTPATEGKVLVDDASVKISTQAHEISVHDKRSGTVYSFHSRLKKRTEGDVEPHRAVISTNTMQVTPLPHGGLEIVTLTDGKVYRIERKWGVL